jgi:hypothetical protein
LKSLPAAAAAAATTLLKYTRSSMSFKAIEEGALDAAVLLSFNLEVSFCRHPVVGHE